MGDDLSNLYMKVWELTAQVPYGRVTTYGAIANAIGSKSSARFCRYSTCLVAIWLLLCARSSCGKS